MSFIGAFTFGLRPTAPMSSQSVILDMIPVNPPVGTLWIASKQQLGSRATAKVELNIAPVGAPTVAQSINLFIEKGMHRYKFDDTGSGCPYWTWTGLQHLQAAGLVVAEAVDALRQFHHDEVAQHPERHQVPIRKGTFY